MATRIQVRRGTTSQWNTANPTLEEGEIGYNSTLGQIKVGDGSSAWADLDYFVSDTSLGTSLGAYLQDSDKSAIDGVAELDGSKNILAPASIIFEGTANDHETTLAVTDPTADRTITLPNVSGTVITTGNLSDITNAGTFTGTIVIEGATADDFELTLSAGNPTADRTITFPDATGTVALTTDITVTASSTNTFSNKSISLGSNTVSATLAELNTAISDADVVSLTGSETLTNKTLTTPVISSITNGAATLTLPTSTGTIALTSDIAAGIVTETGTQTLTNKTLTSPVITGAVFNDGSIVFEGATANDYETTLTVTDPTADRTITFPNETGTVQLRVTDVSDTEIGYLNGVTSAIQTQMDTKAPLAGPALTGDATAVNLTISGNLTVNGTTTNINSTNLVVEDKNIVIGDTETPSDATADGGGITLKGATDKTFNWVDATDAWTSSEDLNLLTGKVYEINGTSVLSSTTLGSGVTGSSLTSVGTIATGTWNGTAIAIANGGTGQTTAMTAATALLPAQTSNSGKYLTTDGSGTLSWGTVSGYLAPTLGSTSIASGATVTTIAGLTLSSPSITGSLTAGGGTGTSGQVLVSTGSGVQWSTPAAGAAFSEFMLIGA